uniref:Uncharacterized protein n=1 Tax=Strongyloides venezuelensis TaxID=75913 RepID=A0A0K0FFS4_STRVS
MFEKLKKIWSSSNNINTAGRVSPKPFRTKSTRNVSNIHLHELTHPPCCNEEERLKSSLINRPPSGTSTADDVSLTKYNVYCAEEVHDLPTQEFIEGSETPRPEDGVTLTPIRRTDTPRCAENGLSCNINYVTLVHKNSQSTKSTDHGKGNFIAE